MPPQLKVDAVRRRRADRARARRSRSTVEAQLLLRRARGRTGGRGARRRSRSTTTRSRTSPAFSSAWPTRNSPATRRISRRRRPTPTANRPSTLDADRSARSDQAARRDGAGQRVRAERPRRHRNADPADPAAAAGDRAALARRRRRGAGRAAGQRRDHRARPRRQADRRQGPALGIAARDLAIRLVFGQRRLAPPHRSCATSRSRPARSTSPPTRRRSLSRHLPAGRYRWEVTDAASGAQSSLRFHVGWWVEAELPDVPDKLEAALDKPSYQPGETAKLFVKAPFAGEAELAIASDRILAMRSICAAGRGRHDRDPGRCRLGQRRLCAGQRLPAAARRLGGSGQRRAGRGAPSGSPGSASMRAPRTLAVALTAPDVARPRGPVEIPVKVAGLAAGEEAYRHARRGRRGGAETDRVRQPGAREILFTASAGSGSSCATSTAG